MIRRVVDLAAGTGRLSGSVPEDRRRRDRRGARGEHAGRARRNGSLRSHAIVARAESMPLDDGRSNPGRRRQRVPPLRPRRRDEQDPTHPARRRRRSPSSGLGRPTKSGRQTPGMRAIYEAIDGTHAEEAAVMAAHQIVGRAADDGGWVQIRSRDESSPRPTSCRRRDSPISTRPSSDVVSLPSSHENVVARPHQGAVVGTARHRASPGKDRRRPVYSTLSGGGVRVAPTGRRFRRAGEGNRTPVSSLGSSRSAIEPHPLDATRGRWSDSLDEAP